MAEEVIVKSGEQKNIQFTITEDGSALDCTGATFTYTVEDTDQTTLFTVADGSFDKTDIATGVVLAPISSTNTTQTPASYDSELKIVFSGGDIEKSAHVVFKVERAIT